MGGLADTGWDGGVLCVVSGVVLCGKCCETFQSAVIVGGGCFVSSEVGSVFGVDGVYGVGDVGGVGVGVFGGVRVSADHE